MNPHFGKILPILFLMTFLSGSAFAQDVVEEFSPERPGAIGGPDVLPKGRVQIESATSWERSSFDGPWTTDWSVAGSILRVGLSDMAEARFRGNYFVFSDGSERTGGFDNFVIGTKIKLLDGGKFIPEMSLLADVLIPGKKGSAFMREYWGGTLALLFENRITDWLYLGYESDLMFYGEGSPELFYGVELFFQPWDKVSFAIDEYNYTGSYGTECWSELSFAYQIASRLQFDLSTDICLSSPSRYAGITVGVSWQITRK